MRRHIHHLPNHILVSIFLHIPLEEILPLELVCRQWQMVQNLILNRVQTLAILAPKASLDRQQTGVQQLIKRTYQRYGIRFASKHYHITLRKAFLTATTCDFFLRKMPNIICLYVCQIPLSSSISQLIFALNGWNIESLTILYDYPIQFHSKRKTINKQNHLHRLLSVLSPDWQPQLRQLTLVTFDAFFQRFEDYQFDLSQLHELNLIRPWDLNRLLTQLVSNQINTKMWTNLRKLTLYSDGNFSTFMHLNPNLHRILQPTFSQLTHLTINFANRTILSIINSSCHCLRSLHLSCVTMSFIDLAVELEPFQFRLSHLRITFPCQPLPGQIEFAPIDDPFKIPLLVMVTSLHLSYSSLLHQPTLAAPILEHIFPKLQTLKLDRNKTIESTCGRCNKMRTTSPACRTALINGLNQAYLTRMVRIYLQIETLDDYQRSDCYTSLQDYEFYCYKRKRWSIESVHL